MGPELQAPPVLLPAAQSTSDLKRRVFPAGGGLYSMHQSKAGI